MKLILSADAKTRGAIMNSRSNAQEGHSLAAAARRHGLHEIARKLEEDIRRITARPPPAEDTHRSRSTSPAPASTSSPHGQQQPIPHEHQQQQTAQQTATKEGQTAVMIHMLNQMQHHNSALNELGIACQTMATAATLRTPIQSAFTQAMRNWRLRLHHWKQRSKS